MPEYCIVLKWLYLLNKTQCFDAVGWVSEGHPTRKNLTDEVLAWLSSGAKCK